MTPGSKQRPPPKVYGVCPQDRHETEAAEAGHLHQLY